MNRFLQRFFFYCIIIFCCLWLISITFPFDFSSSTVRTKGSTESKNSLNSEKRIGDDGNWDGFAIALKTGSDVALERVPVQLLTFLADFRNKIIIGDGPNIRVGGLEVIDVYTNLYDDVITLEKRHGSILVNTSSVGWKTDAHKNLPGFRTLHENFPNAKWYIMIDDDTYLLKHNLADFVADLDHTKAYYFGLPSSFKGCDGIAIQILHIGVKNYHEGPYFAQGGSGIVLSSGAMKAMTLNIENCIVKYKTCFAGDVRLGLCLRDSGVLLTKNFAFHKQPPHMMRNIYACEKSITFHHMLVKQIQQLWDFESEWYASNKTLITFSDIYHGLVGKKDGEEFMVDTDMPGFDIYHFNSSDAVSCQTSCRNEPTCVSFSYRDSVCWLKDAIPFGKERKDAISGIFPEKFRCRKSQVDQ